MGLVFLYFNASLLMVGWMHFSYLAGKRVPMLLSTEEIFEHVISPSSASWYKTSSAEMTSMMSGSVRRAMTSRYDSWSTYSQIRTPLSSTLLRFPKISMAAGHNGNIQHLSQKTTSFYRMNGSPKKILTSHFEKTIPWQQTFRDGVKHQMCRSEINWIQLKLKKDKQTV